MADSTIIITGANSYLGGATIERLINNNSNGKIVALVSPRWSEDKVRITDDRLRYIKADLTRDFDESVRSVLYRANYIFHFAWIRGKRLDEIVSTNCQIIERLIEAIPSPNSFRFISSVAASPGALSVYGRSKYRAMQLVREKGGVSMVCGLVVDKAPHGPFNLLTKCVATFPIRFRFNSGGPQVYPVHLSDVTRCIEQTLREDLIPAPYKLFERGICLNSFLAILESVHPGARLPLFIWTPLVLTLVKLLKCIDLIPANLIDKVLTFLHKEDDYLMSHRDVPNMTYQPINQDLLK